VNAVGESTSKNFRIPLCKPGGDDGRVSQVMHGVGFAEGGGYQAAGFRGGHFKVGHQSHEAEAWVDGEAYAAGLSLDHGGGAEAPEGGGCGVVRVSFQIRHDLEQIQARKLSAGGFVECRDGAESDGDR
jgi:hypothetical protein